MDIIKESNRNLINKSLLESRGDTNLEGLSFNQISERADKQRIKDYNTQLWERVNYQRTASERSGELEIAQENADRERTVDTVKAGIAVGISALTGGLTAGAIGSSAFWKGAATVGGNQLVKQVTGIDILGIKRDINFAKMNNFNYKVEQSEISGKPLNWNDWSREYKKTHGTVGSYDEFKDYQNLKKRGEI
jgi:F0F1-type ATP synthase membrane subunit c/vacuolar-type H+-ATPase subunit K